MQIDRRSGTAAPPRWRGAARGRLALISAVLLLGPGSALAQSEPPATWYDPVRCGAPLAVFLVFSILVLYFIWRSRRGSDLFIRRIAGISAMEEAVGRATELGKKVLYLMGANSIDDNQTIASLAVLRHVAGLSAQYAVDLTVPCKDPLAFAAARETTEEAYMAAGRPDLFTPETVNYVTYDQFAYTASVTGLMVRERPAANFLIGAFHAESLLLAETGQTTGAIQIAGTAEVTQLPFFAVVCDYTLMGEELYAAGAYLAREPAMLGSIKGQDFTKAGLILYLIAGILLEIFGISWLREFMRLG
ncbi:MAG: hypothetical protein GF330_12595 [Candidatus Eisenbacteria bacterium]|nr:hypothetical protein [Candidatus Eisenbacteria bacterium]